MAMSTARSHPASATLNSLSYLACLLLIAAAVAEGQEQAPATPMPTHMSEAVRTGIGKVVVIGGHSPSGQAITGSYEQATEGLVGGIDSGSRIGTITKDIGGVPVSFPIPMLTIPGAIYGGLSGAAKRRIQEFRDALTEELARAENDSLSSTGLAQDVYFGLRNLPHLETKIYANTEALPEDTDAILFVGLNDIVIDVDGDEAILTTSARATLRRARDGWGLYDNVVNYQDRDTLANWTDNDNALWRDYAAYARHYLGREIAAEVFGKVALHRELRPQKTADVSLSRKNAWQGETSATAPTLAWELKLLGGDAYGPWTESITAADITYDLEIYDPHRLVYAEYQLPDASHKLAFDLEDCQTYRWSVRPAYRVGNGIRFGECMRTDEHSNAGPNGEFGIFGESASEVPAYTRHFATLEVGCGRR